jgi:hypothetical protein
MKTIGITIPPDYRPSFDDKSVVYLEKENHQLFIRAFRDIYYHFHLPKNQYRWKESV